ncbi:MAG TPA: tetratricopeptide repeat protein [Symbiobacteriaceae bacterium]|jgi:Flp pilus assembly protein TadD|nr:tetratricopeptide repeat protein [Symbiobacteriaceae bacterium]
MRRIAALALILVIALGGCARPAATTAPVSAPQLQPAAPEPAPAAQPVAPTPQQEYQEALALLQAGERYKAQEKLEKLVAQNPEFAEAWNDLALLRIKRSWNGLTQHTELPGQGRKDQPAIVAARKALELRPGWAFAQYNLGMALLANGEYAPAVEPLRESARQQPERPEPLVALGLALMGAEKHDEAAAACRQALALDKTQQLAADCLDQLADGGALLPVTEAAIGSFRWDPAKRDFVWTGAGKAPGSESSPVSPPWTCAIQYSNGYRESFVDCNYEPWYFRWAANSAAAGTTPAGVGIGTPLAEVTRRYGAARRNGKDLFYRAGDLLLELRLDEQDRVIWYSFMRTTPYFLINDLFQG